MYQSQFEKNARRNRRKAMVFTIAFHVVLIALLGFGKSEELQDLIPDNVKEMLGMTQDSPDELVAEVPKP